STYRISGLGWSWNCSTSYFATIASFHDLNSRTSRKVRALTAPPPGESSRPSLVAGARDSRLSGQRAETDQRERQERLHPGQRRHDERRRSQSGHLTLPPVEEQHGQDREKVPTLTLKIVDPGPVDRLGEHERGADRDGDQQCP